MILTLGSRGSLLINEATQKHFETSKVNAVVRLFFIQINFKDTTGAGDCFLGSLAYFLSIGQSLEKSIEKANQVASVSVQSFGTQTSFPWKKDLPSSMFE